MHRLGSVLAQVAVCAAWTACSVPEKQPAITDGGVDAAEPEPTGAPETRITSAPSAFSNAATATFEFSSTHPNTTFECNIDDGPFAPCTSPFARMLADGPHGFSVRAISKTGVRDDTPAEHVWSIDTVAPSTTITEAPPAADNSSMVRFSFIANEVTVAFECALDGAAFATCRSGDEFGPVRDGAHSFAVRARDRAGNLDASPAIHAWSVDTSTPDTTILSGPAAAVASATATFSFGSPDAGPGASFQCSLDGAPFTPCTSPIMYDGLAMGVHTFEVRVRDATGNLDPTPATRTWTVDLAPPETTITAGPSGAVNMASTSISFTSNEADVVFACSLDDQAFAECTSPFTATDLSQGAHTFEVRATDAAGNTDPTPATMTWTVDTVVPMLAITGGPNDGDTTGPRVAFTWTASEGVIECRFDAQAAWMACDSPLAFNAPSGATTFYLRATDAAGNATTLQRSWQVACSAPTVTGALGLLHLDDDAQILVNATAGADATRGPTAIPEPADPTSAPARFGAGLEFAPAEGDLVAWPVALGDAPAFAIELWVRPEPVAGTRDVLVTGDSRIAIRVAVVDLDTVRFAATVVENAGVMHTVTSAPYAARQWHHVVLSLQQPQLRLWIDGDRTEVGEAQLAIAPLLDAIQLGGNLSGDLDEVWLAQTAFTTDEQVLERYCPALTLRL